MHEELDLKQRRRQILTAASRLFAHYGLNKTTVADIAKAASVGVGTVYLEFSSKEEVVGALSTDCYTHALALMQQAAAKGAYAKRLAAVFDARTEHFLEFAKVGQHAVELMHCSANPVQTAAQRFHEDEESLLADLLRKGDAAAELDVSNPKRSARVLLRAYASFVPPWLMAEKAETQRELLRATHELVLRGLLRRS
jgi:AcrR family transcriptional regulator